MAREMVQWVEGILCMLEAQVQAPPHMVPGPPPGPTPKVPQHPVGMDQKTIKGKDDI